MLRLVLVLLSSCILGCGTSPMSPATSSPDSLDVRIQLFGAREWSANVVIFHGPDSFVVAKPGYDTSELRIGSLPKGTRFTMRTASGGRCEFFKSPDSIRVLVGTDTIVTYWPEGIEAVYTVRGK